VDIATLIQSIVAEVKNVSGVKAIVLGGSRARGTNTPSSDIDLGIYYDEHHLLDLGELSKIATRLDDEHRTDLLTATGGWGPWINGGGWLRIQSFPVDFLYRDLEKIKAVISACLAVETQMATAAAATGVQRLDDVFPVVVVEAAVGGLGSVSDDITPCVASSAGTRHW